MKNQVPFAFLALFFLASSLLLFGCLNGGKGKGGEVELPPIAKDSDLKEADTSVDSDFSDANLNVDVDATFPDGATSPPSNSVALPPISDSGFGEADLNDDPDFSQDLAMDSVGFN